MSLHFSTKAGTLAGLQGVLKTARIAPLRSFSVSDWHANRQACLAGLVAGLGSPLWIVRSSCGREDGSESSNAGAFLSISNVDSDGLEAAVDQVIAAYGEACGTDGVLVQPMLTHVVRSGVAFSHDPNTCAPYRVVNWSAGSNTATVTSGMGGRVWQQAAYLPPGAVLPAPTFEPVVALLEELLTLFDGVPLDCEFAVTIEQDAEVLWLLQARPLILSAAPESEVTQADRLENIRRMVVRGLQPHPFLMGRRTVYGVMPDWNPAEIVGIRPKPLALSLYRELITDSIWAYQRHNYGYRNLRSFPLMPHFFGLPYIDVRLSFNSFIPADLDEVLAGRLVDYYIDRLLAEPTLHDKVEFEIVFSCYTFDLTSRLDKLSDAGFSKIERDSITDSLRKLTNRIVNTKNGLWREDASKLGTLRARRDNLLASSADKLERIYWLLEDGKRYGTLPFAGLARAGFIAVQILQSLVACGVLSQKDYDSFFNSLSTVSGQLSKDRASLDKVTFLSQYGHLRPGTYDILSPRYDESPDLYFDWSQRPQLPKQAQPFVLTNKQKHEIVKLLDLNGLESDPVDLLDFIKSSIELRELSKFEFSRNLSDALALITEVGDQYGFTREDLAYCDISVFKELHVSAVDIESLLSESIKQGKNRFEETKKISLPPLISKVDDIWSFEWPDSAPNFITQKQITAQTIKYSPKDTHLKQLAGSIVFIQHADPGFDWLFAFPIAGLITAWGGANSHMAIRAGEIGLPAVIGTGQQLFDLWSQHKRLHIDCLGRRVELFE